MAEVNLNPGSALTEATPDNILLGAGMFCEGVVLNDTDTTGKAPVSAIGGILGCTNGGSKLSIVPNIVDVSIDQTNIAREGLKVKRGETAYMEPNMTELKSSVLAKTVIGSVTDKTDYSVIKPRETITAGDYIVGCAFIGTTATGKPVIIWFKKALVTGGISLEPKKGEPSATPIHFECVGDLVQANDVLPYEIIWPKSVSLVSATAEDGGVK